MSNSNQVQTRPPLVDLWGVTCEHIDDYSNHTFIDSLLMSLQNLRCDVTTRIVYHPDVGRRKYTPNPDDYDSVTNKVKTVSNVMGEVLDSWYWDSQSGYDFTKPRYIDRVKVFLQDSILLQDVDVWEIGNETNGTWVHDGKTSEVMEILDSSYKLARALLSNSKKTALTLYFYPTVACVEDENPPEDAENYMMLKWATDFVNNYPDVVNNIDYVLISYYHANFIDIDTTQTEGWFWYEQIDSLTRLFPNSLFGFGEIGWPEDDNIPEPSIPEKVNIVNTYYPWAPPNMQPGYPWMHAGFYWNYDTDCVLKPTNFNYRGTAVWRAIDSIMGECNNDGDRFGKSNNQLFKAKKQFDYSLSQNYPNPFNPVTKINFALPKQGFVSLKIYDVLGREVRTLVSEVKSAGNFSVDFNGAEFSSGVYFYRLEADGFTDIKRMMLIK